MSLPLVPARYDQGVEEERNRQINAGLDAVYRRDQDVEISGGPTARSQRLVLRSPDGNRWSIEVDNAGAISATAL